MAVWSSRYKSRLPDSAFAWVDPRTGARKLPIRDARGHLSLAHVRNALARLGRTKLPSGVKRKLRARLRALLARKNPSHVDPKVFRYGHDFAQAQEDRRTGRAGGEEYARRMGRALTHWRACERCGQEFGTLSPSERVCGGCQSRKNPPERRDVLAEYDAMIARAEADGDTSYAAMLRSARASAARAIGKNKETAHLSGREVMEMYAKKRANPTDDEQVAMTIAQQMGGVGAFRLMLGAKTVAYGDSSLIVLWPSRQPSKGNKLVVKYNRGADDYTMTFWNTRTGRTVQSFHGVYADSLVDLFEQQTGYVLRVPKVIRRNPTAPRWVQTPAERKAWADAEALAAKHGMEDNYGYVTRIAQSLLGLTKRKKSSKRKDKMAVYRKERAAPKKKSKRRTSRRLSGAAKAAAAGRVKRDSRGRIVKVK